MVRAYGARAAMVCGVPLKQVESTIRSNFVESGVMRFNSSARSCTVKVRCEYDAS